MGGFSWLWFLIASGLILGAKIFLGLSWLNLWYSLLGLFEAFVLFSQVHWGYWFLFVLIFIILLIKKLFFRKSEDNYILFFYLLEGWIILSLALYFVNQFPLYWSLIVYLLGAIIFLRILFFLKNKLWSIESLFLLILLGEFFLLEGYLSIKILPLALLLGLTFWSLGWLITSSR